ncbi:hypothetical protein EYZ11_000738 [Aspergillus tanneri]|uniref:Uncharacterized protein n=1 Tax=Aspergillus tanneri TaxID=1220188 RepID=A0A4S3JWF9_9EURO|nr:hypothetical protein EYZ11_000738 [Aspergillus tanneri]
MALQQPPQSAQSRWVFLAVTSGAFAALNGLFAKLTTDEHTSAFTKSLLQFFNATHNHPILELSVRVNFRYITRNKILILISL